MLSRQFLRFGGGLTTFDLCQRWRAGETAIRHDGDLLLLGREQADILKTLGDELVPINREYFSSLHANGQLPMIMNHYHGVIHSQIKRNHLVQTRQMMGGDFRYRMAAHVKRTFESLAGGGNVDLVVAVTEAVIDFHLREFLNVEASSETIRAMAYFEDHFTMGLYLGLEELDPYYGATAFVQHRQAFRALVDKWLHKPSPAGMSGLVVDFTPADFFYNFSVAGSTNVAKGFVYGLQLLAEQDQSRESPDAEAMVKEVLRFLPLVDNHVVPSFVARRPTDHARTWLTAAGHGDISGLVYLFHALDHANPDRFENPDRFDPWRWKRQASAPNLMTFGVGSHSCCGSRLAEAWLYSLFEVWRSTFRLAAPLTLRSDPFVDFIPRAQRLTSGTIIEHH